MKTRILLASALLAVTGWAADLAGPVSGYLFHANSHSLRPVLGIPGASILGQPLDLGFETALVAVAPRQDYLLAAGTDGQLRLLRLDPRGAGTTAVETPHGAPDQIIFSPRGTAALFVKGRTVDVVTGAPGAATVARTLDLSSIAGAALAVSDDGAVTLALGTDGVYAAGASAEWARLAPGTAAAFAPGSHDAVVADRTARTVSIFTAVTEGGASRQVAGPDEGITAPVAVAFAGEGKVLAANGDNGTVTVLDTAAGTRAALNCACTPTGLTSFGGLFRLNEPGEGPLWLVDARAPEAALVFIPALVEGGLR
jgi:hypothetical protein